MIRWNPSIEDQAIDRVHRLGQSKPVTVYRLICRDSVEERLLLLQEKKRSCSEKAMEEDCGSGFSCGTENTANKLSLNELKALFLR